MTTLMLNYNGGVPVDVESIMVYASTTVLGMKYFTDTNAGEFVLAKDFRDIHRVQPQSVKGSVINDNQANILQSLKKLFLHTPLNWRPGLNGQEKRSRPIIGVINAIESVLSFQERLELVVVVADDFR